MLNILYLLCFKCLLLINRALRLRFSVDMEIGCLITDGVYWCICKIIHKQTNDIYKVSHLVVGVLARNTFRAEYKFSIFLQTVAKESWWAYRTPKIASLELLLHFLFV